MVRTGVELMTIIMWNLLNHPAPATSHMESPSRASLYTPAAIPRGGHSEARTGTVNASKACRTTAGCGSCPPGTCTRFSALRTQFVPLHRRIGTSVGHAETHPIPRGGHSEARTSDVTKLLLLLLELQKLLLLKWMMLSDISVENRFSNL